MGLKSHAQSEGFSADLNAYLKHIINGHGRDDLSGRWLTEITHSARARDYWSKLVKNERAMNTNDIDVLATAFGMSPFEFVRQARALAEGDEVPVPNVRPLEEDVPVLSREEEQALRKSDHDIAAYRGRNEADIPHAE